MLLLPIFRDYIIEYSYKIEKIKHIRHKKYCFSLKSNFSFTSSSSALTTLLINDIGNCNILHESKVYMTGRQCVAYVFVSNPTQVDAKPDNGLNAVPVDLVTLVSVTGVSARNCLLYTSRCV